jgi:hypothetical protein
VRLLRWWWWWWWLLLGALGEWWERQLRYEDVEEDGGDCERRVERMERSKMIDLG